MIIRFLLPGQHHSLKLLTTKTTGRDMANPIPMIPSHPIASQRPCPLNPGKRLLLEFPHILGPEYYPRDSPHSLLWLKSWNLFRLHQLIHRPTLFHKVKSSSSSLLSNHAVLCSPTLSLACCGPRKLCFLRLLSVMNSPAIHPPMWQMLDRCLASSPACFVRNARLPDEPWKMEGATSSDYNFIRVTNIALITMMVMTTTTMMMMMMSRLLLARESRSPLVHQNSHLYIRKRIAQLTYWSGMNVHNDAGGRVKSSITLLLL